MIADSRGYDSVSEDVGRLIAACVSAKLHDLIKTAQKFAYRAKRTKITPDDIDRAMRMKGFEVFGLPSVYEIIINFLL